jgi:hypothetical protein
VPIAAVAVAVAVAVNDRVNVNEALRYQSPSITSGTASPRSDASLPASPSRTAASPEPSLTDPSVASVVVLPSEPPSVAPSSAAGESGVDDSGEEPSVVLESGGDDGESIVLPSAGSGAGAGVESSLQLTARGARRIQRNNEERVLVMINVRMFSTVEMRVRGGAPIIESTATSLSSGGLILGARRFSEVSVKGRR